MDNLLTGVPRLDRPIKELSAILQKEEGGHYKENEIQAFLEAHSEMIPLVDMPHRKLVFRSILSKPQISRDYIADFAYATDNSDTLKITFVEIESSAKKIFTQRDTFTQHFNDAVAQVENWIRELNDSIVLSSFINDFHPFFSIKNTHNLHVECDYVLVIGRSEDKNKSLRRKEIFRQKVKTSGINIITYDGLVKNTIARYGKYDLTGRCNDLFHAPWILSRRQNGCFHVKHCPWDPGNLLCYFGPHNLSIPSHKVDALTREGYQMDEWKDGQPLCVNSKYSLRQFEEKGWDLVQS